MTGPRPDDADPGELRPAIPWQVTAAAVLFFVSGGLTLVFALLAFALNRFAPIFTVVAVALLALGGIEVFIGVRLRRLDPSARSTALALAGLVAALSVLALIRSGYPGVVGLGWGFVLVLLLTRPEVVRAF